MRLALLLSAVLVLAPASVASAQTSDPNTKTTVTDIQYRISYSVTVPGNCAILSFSQWEDAKFRGWEATRVSINVATSTGTRADSFGVSAPPTYDDQLQYGGNTVSPPAGSHWVLIGNGSYRAGPPPADPDCQNALARTRTVVPDGKVTTTFRRTTVCATKFARLAKARKAAKKAKGASARAKANRELKKAKRSFAKDCTE